MTYPTFIATSVVRGAEQGQSHGGIYIVNMETGSVDQTLDWNTCNIDFEGRGADRGLRGIALHNDEVYIAASDEIFVFDRKFQLKKSLRCRFLKHCHEIAIWRNRLYLTSTGFDSILIYNLELEKFTDGIFLDLLSISSAASGDAADNYRLLAYHPESGIGPEPTNKLHLNSITCDDSGVYFSGLRANCLFKIYGATLSRVGHIPKGTHNAQLHDGGLLYNDTASDQVCYVKNGEVVRMAVPGYERASIINIDKYESRTARPGFARGLAPVSGDLVAGGSSPSTLSLYDLRTGERLRSINLSMDVRNAIHGLEVWA